MSKNLNGTEAVYTNGCPWAGGQAVTFTLDEIEAVGTLHQFGDFVKRTMVRLRGGQVVFVKVDDQPEPEKKWLRKAGRKLAAEMRERAINGTLVIPSRDNYFTLHWTTPLSPIRG